jgi:hypothetical protein
MSSLVLCAEEIKPIVEKLVAEYPANLSEVDPERIIYVKSQGKRGIASIKAVSTPYDLVMKYK